MVEQRSNVNQSLLAPSKTSNRLAYVDTLRGFAACWVFLDHIHSYWLGSVRPTGIDPARLIVFIAGIGGFGVDLFIVLSGFCLFYPLIRTSKELKPGFNAASFYRRRAYRLLPAYYIALAVVTLLVLSPKLQPLLTARPLYWFDVLSYAFLLQTFSSYTTGSINGSLWSIALEAQLYLVFPFLLLLYKRRGMTAVILAGLTSAIIWPAVYGYLFRHAGMQFNPVHHFPGRWIEFIMGMCAALIVCHPVPGSKKWAAAIFVVTLPGTVIMHTGLLFHRFPFVETTFAGVTFASLVIFLAAYREEVFIGKNPLGALTRLGVISYSFYLLHQPIILLTVPFAHAMHLGIIPTFALGIVTAFPLTVLIGYIFFVYIERPFLERGKRPKLPMTDQAVTEKSPVIEAALP